ncbi:GDSL esterase/lipase At3g27950-like isoform X2 [Silene latifolia]|uniref:GDSL esterase/lipase At3g27950-like isoform X2 n=1 Tax=Silene latifolia TaxID=37657 RepID=UPI003D779239
MTGSLGHLLEDVAAHFDVSRVFWGLPSFLVLLALTDADATIFGTGNKGQFPAIFNFGDSNSDTGACSAVFKHAPHPNGITFFGKPSGRLSDGRLIIDFIAEKLSLPYLSAYLDAMEANFKHGANFAVSATSIMPVDRNLYGQGITPIPLNMQLLQFQQFKERVEKLYETSMLKDRLPKPEDFSKALYTIDIGQNDLTLLNATSRHQTYIDIIDRFSLSIEQLHELGARRFLIHNTGPLVCLPMSIDNHPSSPTIFDEIGCMKSSNEIARKFNQLLTEKVYLLRTKLEDSTLVYVDIYSAKYSLFRDAKRYGFVDPLGYCCKGCMGSETPYWNRTIGNPTVVPTACDDPSKYISWDGVHYTEAANHLLANQIFDGSILDPLVN